MYMTNPVTNLRNRFQSFISNRKIIYHYTIPRYLPWLLAATVVYLGAELVFNAYLIDFALSVPSPGERHTIEVVGRVLSGIALVLWLYGTVILPWIFPRIGWSEFREKTVAIILIVTALVTVPCVYRLEAALLDTLVSGPSLPAREQALYLETVVHGSVLGSALPQDVADAGADMKGSVGRAVLAGYPLTAWLAGIRPAMSDTDLHEMVRAVLNKEMGGLGVYRGSVFNPSVEAIYALYDRYSKATARYRQVLDGIPAEQDNGWERYVSELARHNWSPDTVPHIWWGTVIGRLRKNGVPVPDGWHPNDRHGFRAAIRSQIESQARETFSEESERAVGKPLSPDLDEKRFILSEPVQALWRKNLGGAGKGTLLPDLDDTALSERLVGPELAERENAYVDQFLSQAPLHTGSSLEQDSLTATRALLAFGLAIIFSTIGLVVHFFKVANYGMMYALPRLKHRRMILASCFLAVLVISTEHELQRRSPKIPSVSIGLWSVMVTNGRLSALTDWVWTVRRDLIDL